ncbi:MAG TPA: hypothetical protein VE779_06115, partial [Candidatus Angelobacter sp.]|nr:hypothetical protein [Candidatus Angelobacter sp.]
MSKARFVLFLFVVGPLFAAAQAAPQRPADDFPSLNTPGETTPQAVSDLNAQLIWLLAAAPGAHDTPQETTARRAYQQA